MQNDSITYCEQPFDNLYIDSTNLGTCCCFWIASSGVLWRHHHPEIWDNSSIGPWEIWNHKVFRTTRKIMLGKTCGVEGRFNLCSQCPRLKRQDFLEELPNREVIMKRGPLRIVMSDDLACNLSCWTCRENQYKGQMKEPVVQLRRKLLDEFLPTAEHLSFLHSGDPFVSKYYREFILGFNPELYPHLDIELFTNGMMIPVFWERMEPFRSKLQRVLISLDAGTEETYNRVRGGNWNKVLEGMRLLQEAGIDLWTNMTITTENVDDVQDFIKISREFGAKRIELKSFLRWWQSHKQWKERWVDPATLGEIPPDVDTSQLHWG